MNMVIGIAVLSAALVQNAHAADVVRLKPARPEVPIARAVEVPAAYATVYVSGVGPDVVDSAKSPGAFGNTRTQTLSVLEKIERTLADLGLRMSDVVKMQVFLVGDPELGGEMDYAGMMDAYKQHFGSAAQPNLPARSTMKVAALANPGWLVEIEVVAVRKSETTRYGKAALVR